MKLIIIVLLVIPLLGFTQVKVKDKHWLPRLVRLVTKEEYAITIGRTIYVSCSADYFLDQQGWVRHELKHVEQYQKYGTLEFLKRYLFVSIFKGHRNKFEQEARKAELIE